MKKFYVMLVSLCLALALPALGSTKPKPKPKTASRPAVVQPHRATQSRVAPGRQTRVAPGRQSSVDHRRFDQRGHLYHPEHFGRINHARFSRESGRMYGGFMHHYYGGNWFYCSFWPQWFYETECYFLLGEDGFWYCYNYGNPGLFFQVYVGE